MNEELAKRVKAAATAGWWTILFAVIFLTVQWLAYLAISACPHLRCCTMKLWGPGVDWTTVQTVWLWLTGVFKVIVWTATMVVIWLSLWARRLRKG